MEVDLTPDQRAFVQEAVEMGRLSGEEEAVREALAMWEERERRRLEMRLAVGKAGEQLARGEGRRVASLEESKRLVDDVARRGMARIVGENAG